MENLFFLLELVGLTPLAMLPTEEPYSSRLRSAAKRSGNERYRRDAAFEYVSYYAAYEDFRIDLARMAEQRQICVAARAAWEEVKTNFPDHFVQTIVRWRKGEDLQTILETEYGK
ncbi:hypothetical protein V1506DRAFT_522608 [Lipomyces tetrasporus]